MGDKELVVDQLKLTYDGVFDLNGLYRTLDQWFFEKGYDRVELKNYEQILPDGRSIELDLQPYKKTTEFFKNIIRIRLKATGVKDITIEKDGSKVNINQGKIMIIFDAFFEIDHRGMWESKAFFFFLRHMLTKFVFKKYYDQYKKWLINDFYEIHGRIQRYLNLYRYEKRL